MQLISSIHQLWNFQFWKVNDGHTAVQKSQHNKTLNLIPRRVRKKANMTRSITLRKRVQKKKEAKDRLSTDKIISPKGSTVLSIMGDTRGLVLPDEHRGTRNVITESILRGKDF